MRPSRPTRGLPTSRAYWELKAEQMMNRVFAPEGPIDLETPGAAGPDTTPGPGMPPHRPLPPITAPGPAPRMALSTPRGSADSGPQTRGPSPLTLFLLAALGGVGIVGALSAVLLVQQWTGLQRSLSQERNLLLVERLRTLGPASSAANTPAAPVTPPAPLLNPLQAGTPQTIALAGDLPPPPPEEPWMQGLADLPASQGNATLLRVPLSSRLSAPAPAAAPTARSVAPKRRPTGPLPQLVGLVGAPGRTGSAIFQVGESSTNVNVGEQIGGSGWTLKAADAESALIEQGSEVRRIAIVSGG